MTRTWPARSGIVWRSANRPSLLSSLFDGLFDHGADFHQQPATRFEPLSGLPDQSFDHFRPQFSRDQRLTRFVILHVTSKLSVFRFADIRWIADNEIKPDIARHGSQQVAAEQLDSIQHSVPDAVFTCHIECRLD